MTGSTRKAGALGPFQTAMKVHQSIQSSTSPRSTTQQGTKLWPQAQRTKPRATLPQGAATRRNEPVAGSIDIEPKFDNRTCLEDPVFRPLRALQLPLGGNKAPSSNAEAQDPRYAAAGDSSLTPPRVRAPLRAAATRAESSYSPEVPRKGVGPFQASASLFQKKKEHSRVSKGSKNRSHGSHHSHSSSRSSKHGTKAHRTHSGHDVAAAERCRSGDSEADSKHVFLPDAQRLASDSGTNSSFHANPSDEQQAVEDEQQQHKLPVPMLQQKGGHSGRALRHNPHVSPRHHHQPLPQSRSNHAKHVQHASDCTHLRVHSTNRRNDDDHMHAAAQLDSAAAAARNALEESTRNAHRTEGSSLLSAIAESDENFTTSHTGGMDLLAPHAQQSPGGDSVTSAMHCGAPPSSVAATCASDPQMSPQDSLQQLSPLQVSPQKSYSPSPVRFHESAVVPPEDTFHALHAPPRKLSPIPQHLRPGNHPEPSRTIALHSKTPQTPLSTHERSQPHGMHHAITANPTAELQTQNKPAQNQAEGKGNDSAAQPQLTSMCARGGENIAFAPSPLSRSPAPSRCPSPTLRPTLSPPSGSVPNPAHSSDAANPPDASADTMTPNKVSSTPSVKPRLGNGREQTASPSRSPPPPDAASHRGRRSATSPQRSAMLVTHAQRALSPPRFQMRDSASMHVQHGGLVLPRRDGVQPHSVDTHAPHALKVHCVTWNMGRTKATPQLAVHLRGSFLGIPRSKSTPVDTSETAKGFGSAFNEEVAIREASREDNCDGAPACMSDEDIGAASMHAPAGGVQGGALTPDMIVVGTQENASPGAWLDLLQEVLTPAGYVLLRGAASMNSAPGATFMMTVAVFVRATLEHHFSNVLVGRVTCGMGNKVGNKGACAVAVTVAGVSAKPTRLLLICCHLEAHTHRLKKRNSNVRYILSSLHLKPPASKRGLSQTLLSSFLPSHPSPLRVGRSRSRVRSSTALGVFETAPLAPGAANAVMHAGNANPTLHIRGKSLPAHAGVPESDAELSWQLQMHAGHAHHRDGGAGGVGESSETFWDMPSSIRDQHVRAMMHDATSMHDVHASHNTLRLSTVAQQGSPAQDMHVSHARADRSRRSASWPESSFAGMVTAPPPSNPPATPVRPRSPVFASAISREASGLASPMHVGSTPVARGARNEEGLLRSVSKADTIVESLQQWERGRARGNSSGGGMREGSMRIRSSARRSSNVSSAAESQAVVSASGASTPEGLKKSMLYMHAHQRMHQGTVSGAAAANSHEAIDGVGAEDGQMHDHMHAPHASPRWHERVASSVATGTASPRRSQRLQASPGKLASKGVRTLMRQVSRSADDLKQTFRSVRAFVDGSVYVSYTDKDNPDRSSPHMQDRHALRSLQGHSSGTSTPVATPPHSRISSIDGSSATDSHGLVDSPVKVCSINESRNSEVPDAHPREKKAHMKRMKSLDLRAVNSHPYSDVPTPKLGAVTAQVASCKRGTSPMHAPAVPKTATPPRPPAGRLSASPSKNKGNHSNRATSICMHDMHAKNAPPSPASAPLPVKSTSENPDDVIYHPYIRAQTMPHEESATRRKVLSSRGVCEGKEGVHRGSIASVCSSMHVCSPSDSSTGSHRSSRCELQEDDANYVDQNQIEDASAAYKHVRRQKSRSMGAVCESGMHDRDAYRSDLFRVMRTDSRLQSALATNSDAASQHMTQSMGSSSSIDFANDVIMAPVPMLNGEGSSENILAASRMDFSSARASDWDRQASSLSDVFTMPFGTSTLASARYPSDAASNACTFSRAPSSSGSMASTAHHGGYQHSQHPSSHNSIPSRMPDAVSAQLLARIASDACANAAAAAASASVAPSQDPLYAPSTAPNDSAAVGEGCALSHVHDADALRGGRGIVSQNSMHVEQVESPGWRCRSLSRRIPGPNSPSAASPVATVPPVATSPTPPSQTLQPQRSVSRSSSTFSLSSFPLFRRTRTPNRIAPAPDTPVANPLVASTSLNPLYGTTAPLDNPPQIHELHAQPDCRDQRVAPISQFDADSGPRTMHGNHARAPSNGDCVLHTSPGRIQTRMHAQLRESMSAPSSPTFQKVLHSQRSSSVTPPAVPSHALSDGSMHGPHAFSNPLYPEQSPPEAPSQHELHAHHAQHAQHVTITARPHSRSPVQFKTIHAAAMSTGTAMYGTTSPLSPDSPSSISGTSAFNACGAESDFEAGESARIGATPTPCATDAPLILDSGYEGLHDVMHDILQNGMHAESLPARTLHPHSRAPMHVNTMPHAHASVAHRASIHKRAVSDFDFSGMHAPHAPHSSVAMGQPQWLKGDEYDGERDISSEFDVTMVLGDLNYRIAEEPETVLNILESCGSDPDAQRMLFSRDQLHNTMTAPDPHPVQNFSEAITDDGRMPFPPTYKFRTGTCMYDGKRTPSWTDRVLWRCNYAIDGQPAVAPMSYACVPSILHSDHRPVVAAMHVQLKHGGELSEGTASGLYCKERMHGCGHGGVGESVALPEQPDAGPRGRTLKRWLQGATSRLRVLKGGDASCPPPQIQPVISGDCAPLRRNLEKLDSGLPDQSWDQGFAQKHACVLEQSGVGVDQSYSMHSVDPSIQGLRDLRGAHSVPRRMRLSAER